MLKEKQVLDALKRGERVAWIPRSTFENGDGDCYEGSMFIGGVRLSETDQVTIETMAVMGKLDQLEPDLIGVVVYVLPKEKVPKDSKRKLRRCLGPCGKDRMSQGPHDRICSGCRKATGTLHSKAMTSSRPTRRGTRADRSD